MGDVVFVTISNPSKRNAISLVMWAALRETFRSLADNPSIRCIVLTGAPPAFSAGADISEFEQTRSTREQVVRFHEEYVGPCLEAIASCDVPVIAAIEGACMGGGLEIASVCDIRIAAKGATFGAPVGRLGFPLAFAETRMLFNLVGATAVAELLIEGRILTATEAMCRSIVTRVSDNGHLDDEVAKCISNILESSITAVRWHKRQIRRLLADASPITERERLEVFGFADSEEYKQGFRRFLAR